MAKSEATLLLRIKTAGKEALDAAGDALAKVGKIAVAVGAAIVGFVGASIQAYREQEAATNSLNQAMIQQGIYTAALSQEYAKMASAIEKATGFGDEQVTQSQAILQGYLGQTKITQELVLATADLAKAKGIDLASAAEMVGKTIGTETNVLARSGIEIDTTASKTEKLAEVVEKLNGRWEGQAAASLKGLGAVDAMKNSISNFMEEVGARFGPLIGFVASRISEMADAAGSTFGIFSTLEAIVFGLSKSFVVLFAAIQDVGAVLGTSIAASMETITQLMQGNFKAAGQAIKDGFQQSAEAITAIHAQAAADLNGIDAARLAAQAQKQDEEETMLSASLQRKAEIQAEADLLRTQNFDLLKEEDLIKEEVHAQILADTQLSAQLARINNEMALETDRIKRIELNRQKELLIEKQTDEVKRQTLTGFQKFKEFLNSTEVRDTQNHLSTISSLQNAKSKELVAIGKAAATANIIISTAQGIMKALATDPIVVGPIVAAGLAITGAAQLAAVHGVQLAEGGVVRARPGGVQATIGEGGQDEAVIPLENGRIPGSGGNTIHINAYGGILGTPSEAREFAVAIDRELFNLRQNGESIFADGNVT